MDSSFCEGYQIQMPWYFSSFSLYLNYMYQSIQLNAFGLINTSFYFLKNKEDILND